MQLSELFSKVSLDEIRKTFNKKMYRYLIIMLLTK